MKKEEGISKKATGCSSGPENKPSTSSTTQSRLKASSKPKDSPKPDTSAVSRAKSVPNLNNNNQSARRRPFLGNRPKSGDDHVPVSLSQKPKVSDDFKALGRSRNHSVPVPVVDQFSGPRHQRPISNHPNCNFTTTKRNEGDPHHRNCRNEDKKTKELREKVDENENLIKDLQSEVMNLKSELDKARSFCAELQSSNIKLSQDLAAAQSQVATLTACNPRGPEVDYQSPNFKDIQKLIATKLEHCKVKNEAINDAGPTGPPATASASKEPADISAVNVHRFVPAACLLRPPPPPPPPPPRGAAKAAFVSKPSALETSHHPPMKPGTAKCTSVSGIHDKPITMSAHSSIVGEIQKRSLHLLAIKADIETKGELINSLIQKVQDASYTNIEDVLKFVDWLDDELSSLADERAVLKHFNWPEKKADSMREAAVEYRSLKLLESKISSYEDDPSIPPGVALKKMAGLLDKSERCIQRLIKLRSSVILPYQHFKIPTDWMLETGIINKIRQASVTLANIYMKRVMAELESIPLSDRESAQGGILLQGIHLSYRAYQFAGGLDSETLCAFEDIRKRVPGQLWGSQELFAGIPSS